MIEGPVEFTAEVDIQRPASDVFPLLDLADPRFRQAQCGAQVQRIEGEQERYDVVLEQMDDVVFHFQVLERTAGQRYTIECAMEPQINALKMAVEAYAIEPIGEAACRVRLTTSAAFNDDLSDEEIANEIAMMSMAVTQDLEKLAVLAEEGLDALKALEEEELTFNVEFGVDFDLEEIDIDWDDIEPKQ
ncbi:MAG: hypothetical protein AAFY81_05835 [Pseudomonadota bacterium]